MRVSLAIALCVLLTPATTHAQKRNASAAMNDALADVAMFRFDQAAARFDVIARDSSYPDRDRNDAAINAVKLHALLGPRDALRGAVATASHLSLSTDDRAYVDYALPDFDYTVWQSKVNEPAARATALTSSSAFFAVHRRDANRERLVESAYRVSRLKRAAGDPATDWLRATADVWRELVTTTQHPPERLAAFAAKAEIDLVMDEVDASPLRDRGQCRYTTLTADAKLADGFDRRLDALRARYVSSLDSVAEVEASRGAVFDGLRAGAYWCGGGPLSPWWTSSATLQQNAQGYWTWNVSLSTTNPPPPAFASAWQLYEQARHDRDAAVDAATDSAVRHYALALDIARARHASNAVLQRAAQRYLALSQVGGDSARLSVERTTSLRDTRKLRADEVADIARGLAISRSFRAADSAPPTPIPLE